MEKCSTETILWNGWCDESWRQVWWIWLCWVIGWVMCWLRKSMTRAKREPLKWNVCSFLQNFGMFHPGRFRNSPLFKLFSVAKTWTVTIFNHFSLREIILWKLAQARCYQPVSLFQDSHHQDFSTITVDTQEWNWGSWGCGWGRMYCKVWHRAGRAEMG